MLQYSRLPVSLKLQPMYYIVFSASLLETCLQVNWFLHLWTAYYFSYCCWLVWEWPVVALLPCDKSRSLIGWKTETPVHQALWLVSVPNCFHASWVYDNGMNEIWTGWIKDSLSKLLFLLLKLYKIVFLCCILNQFLCSILFVWSKTCYQYLCKRIVRLCNQERPAVQTLFGKSVIITSYQTFVLDTCKL